MIYSFGDSWAYGAELDSGESPFVYHYAEGKEYKNFGREGASLACVLDQIEKKVEYIDSDDTVLVIVPPDVRWYTRRNFSNSPLFLHTLEYQNSVGDKDIDWFIWHHAIFVSTIQSLLNATNCRYAMALNYGSIEELFRYKFPIDSNKFISSNDLTTILSNGYQVFNSYQLNSDGPGVELFTGPYFEGKYNHPNDLGHRMIAKLFRDYFTSNP